MATNTITVTITARDEATPRFAWVGDRLREIDRLTRRLRFLRVNAMRRKPQGPQPKHYPRRRHGR